MHQPQKKITQVLVQDWNYSEKQVQNIANKLLAMDPLIKEAFSEWLQTGIIPSYPKFAGFSPNTLSLTYPNMKPPAIFLLLDWLHIDSKEALSALKQEYGINTPVDQHT